MSRVAVLAIVGLCACGRSLTYEAWREAAGGGSEAGGGLGGGGVGGRGGGAGDGGGHEVAPGCTADEARYTGRGPTPPPAGIPRLQLGFGLNLGISGSAPWFDFSTGLLTGTASKAGQATFSFEGVVVKVRVDAGDTAAAVAARLVRCARVPGYRFETTPPPNTFVGVRRDDSRVFARIFVENSHMDPRFVFEDDEGIPYWLSILERPGGPALQLSARGKPICAGGGQAREPAEKRLNTKQGVLFSWDGTYFTDGGACSEREMYDGGTLFLIACARLLPAPAGAEPFTRPDAGAAVDCIAQQAVLGPVAPGAPVAIVFNW